MAEWILTSSLLIVIVLAVRALFRGRMGLRLRYALWLLVLLRLLVPGTVFQTGLSVLNYVPLPQTAAVQAQHAPTRSPADGSRPSPRFSTRCKTARGCRPGKRAWRQY